MTVDDPGTPSMICHNEVNTHYYSPDTIRQRNARNAIVIRVHLGSNDRRGATQETTFPSRHLTL